MRRIIDRLLIDEINIDRGDFLVPMYLRCQHEAQQNYQTRYHKGTLTGTNPRHVPLAIVTQDIPCAIGGRNGAGTPGQKRERQAASEMRPAWTAGGQSAPKHRR